MKKVLLILVGMLSCATDGTLEIQRTKMATDWLSQHNADGMIVSCPSKKMGTPFCDITKDGKVVFWLGCHIDTQHCFQLREYK